MHRRRRWATVVAFAVAAGSAAAATSAGAAAAGATLYVNNTVSTCSDSGGGAKAAPYCDVQDAFSAVKAGGTVIIVAGKYTLPATIAASGTAAAPITVSFGTPGAAFVQATAPSLTGSSTPALTLTNASYVDIDNAYVIGGSAAAVSVTGSSHVTFTGGDFSGGTTGLAIAGASRDVSATRLTLGGATTAASIGSGVTGTVIATDYVNGGSQGGSSGDGVDVDGASGTDIVGNTMQSCGTTVAVSGGATGTTIENNIVDVDGVAADCQATSLLGLNVDADSAAGTREKYDTIFAGTVTAGKATPVRWAGTDYDSADAYQTATGQGAQDIIHAGVGVGGVAQSDYVDNADALAPGETPTDYRGSPRMDNPYVPNTGTGVGYYDRGSYEETDNFTAEVFSTTVAYGTANVAQLLLNIGGGWLQCTTKYTVTIQWGDRSSSTLSGAPCAAASAKASPADGVGCEACLDADHTYAEPGTYAIAFTATDGTVSQTGTASFTTLATDYSAYGPTRILDTRKAIGVSKAKVPQGSAVHLKVAGDGGIPADVTAVALNITVTDATGKGTIAARADGGSRPQIANFDYGAGQTVANAAIVPVGADGYIDIDNNGAAKATADLIADVTGYFRPAKASGYAPTTLSRILDTRKGIGARQAKIAGGGSVPVRIAGVDSIPASGVTAVAVHVTAADTAGSGWIATVPDGTGVPSTSTLNYAKGQIVSNTVIVPVASDGEIRLYNGGGTTPVDLIADVAGYFSAGAANHYVPLKTPTRAVDTLTSGSAIQPGASGHYWLSAVPNAAAVVANVTVTQPAAGGYVTAYPDGVARPAVSNVDFLKGQTVTNLAVLDTNTGELPATNILNVSTGTTDVIVDVFGYFAD